MSQDEAAPTNRIANWICAGLLAAAGGYWALTLSHFPPSKLFWPLACSMLLAAIGMGTGKRSLNVCAVLLGSAGSLLWLVSFYRMQPDGSPLVALDAIPLGGVWLSLLSAAALVILWARWTRWLGLDERRRFVFFVIGALPLLAVSADLCFLGKAFLQPLRGHAYHPYLTYGIDGSYGFAHAREREVVDLKGMRFTQKKGQQIRIVLAGASTSWGFGLEDEHSLPRVLQTKINAAFPGQEIEIITVAYVGKYQLNELVDSVVTLPHWDPDLVISLNGFNEVWYGEKENRYEGMPYIEAQMRTRATLSCLATRFSYIGALYFSKTESKRVSPYRLKQDSPDLPPRYFDYLKATAANLKRNKIRYAFAFCPNVQEKQKRSQHEREILAKGGDWIAKVGERRRRSDEIIRSEGQFVFDVMRPLRDEQQSVFLDECHLNPHGVELVAEEIVRLLPVWIPQLANVAP